MATSSTLKALKKEDEPLGPREQPVPIAHANGLTGRLQTWQQSIWRRRWLSVATAWAICVAGWAVIALWPTSFNATAVIYANLAELRDEKAADQEEGRTPVAMLRSMLLSEDRLDEVRAAVALDPVQSRALEGNLMLRSTVPPVFVLAYEHADPDTAQKVLKTVIDGFQARLNDERKAAGEAARVLDGEIVAVERRLQTNEASLVSFKRDNADHLNGAGSRTAELALLHEEVDSLEKQLKVAIDQRDAIATDLAAARETEAEAAEPEAANAEPERSRAELETERKALETELAKLKERYADTHPYVVAVFDAIKAVDAEVEALATPVTPVAANDPAPIDRDELEQRHGELIVEVSALNSRLGDKRQEIGLLEALTKTTTSVEAELSGLEAAKEELSTALADLQRRRDALSETEGGEATQEAFRLIKQPELPTDPIGPSRLMALAAVLVGGTGLGAIAAVFRNRYKGVFESAWQLRRRFDVGVLGTISEVMTPAERKQLGYSRLAFGLACLGLIGAFSGLVIAEMTNQLAPFGEHLRTQLLG